MSCDPIDNRDGTLGPRKIYLELTTDCNLNCAMCIRHSWAQGGGPMGEQTFAAVLAQLRDLPTVTTINLSGYGEPLSHPRALAFARQAKAAGLRVEMVTNGLLLDTATIDAIIEMGLDRLIVSVDGLSAESSRLLHAVPFDAICTALQSLYHQRMNASAPAPDVMIEFVATRRNIHELPTLKGLAPVLGFSSILVTNLIPHAPELAADVLYSHWSTRTRRRCQPSPYGPSIDFPLMDVDGVGGRVFDQLRRSGTRLSINGVETFGGPPVCPFISRGRFAIRYDGRVSPCLPLLHDHAYYPDGQARRSLSYGLGNVHQSTLREIWDSPEYRAFRQRVEKFEFSPCMDCGGCDLRGSNTADCTSDHFPRCGACLWAVGLVQCP